MEWEMILRLLLAGVLGALIGIERRSRYKEAGLRTHFVVALGSALMMLVSKYGFGDLAHSSGVILDPSRIAAQVVSGIGFLGAGTIIVQRQSIRGLTTAAGLWTTAGIGLAIGAGMYIPAVAATLLVLLALEVLDRGERAFLLRKAKRVTIRTTNVDQILNVIGASDLQMTKVQIDQSDLSSTAKDVVLTVQVHSRNQQETNRFITKLQETQGVESVRIDG